MFCKHCGNELPENANFCPVCGQFTNDTKQAPEENASTYFEAPASEPVKDIFGREKRELGGSILKFAILGLAFGASCLLSPLGLIFTIISRTKLGKYVDMFGDTEGTATVGKHLGLAAIITNIVMLALLALNFIIIFIAIAVSA